MRSPWRDISERIIRRISSENRGLSKKGLKRLFRAAYPFGEREHWPYKMWLRCVGEYFGEIQTPKENMREAISKRNKKAVVPDLNQLEMYQKEKL